MLPWRAVAPLAPAEHAHVRRRAIFDCCKWDAQVQDVSAVAPFPIVLTSIAWEELRALATALAREVLAAEAELATRPELHAALGLPRPLRRALRDVASRGAARGVARLIRFDFHHTTDGWRISEANTDVPGGMNEATGLPPLMAQHYDDVAAVGDVAAIYVRRLQQAAHPGARIALLHATAFSDDSQVMTWIRRRLAQAGLQATLASPDHVRWSGDDAHLDAAWQQSPLDVLVRFFPAEWLPDLPRRCRARQYFAGARTPASNPATALLTQSKRFPLVWDELRTPLPTWRALLPETRDPCMAPRSGDWVLKPALGRVGEGIGMSDVVAQKEMDAVTRAARRRPEEWIAQRRFSATSLEMEGLPPMYPCIGVYTVDDEVAGAYGRVAPRPLIDWRAQDAAVLVTQEA